MKKILEQGDEFISKEEARISKGIILSFYKVFDYDLRVKW